MRNITEGEIYRDAHIHTGVLSEREDGNLSRIPREEEGELVLI